jgi:ATP-dependent Clp protease, protease subunit
MKRLSPILLLCALALLIPGCAVYYNGQNDNASFRDQRPVDFSDPVLNRRQVLLIGGITEDVAEETIQKLLYLDAKGQEPIDLFLMTPGGELKSAFAIEQVIKLLHSKVNTFALSECNSGGAFLLAAGTGERAAFSNALIIIHGITAKGSPPPRVKDILQDYYTAFWKRRTHLPETWVPIPPGKLIFLTAQDALKYGLIDKIIDK